MTGMAPEYKLTYFDVRGFAEPARYLLKYGGIDFEDNRILQEDWPKLKDGTPFGEVPVLEHNGRKSHQSVAICKYLGKVVKLAGNDEWEDLEIDAVVDTINDLRLKISIAFWEQDQEKKKVLRATTLEETIPFYLERLEEIVKRNDGFLALGRLTWADFYFAAMTPNFDNFASGIFDNYPTLVALRNKVETLPAIKEWIEIRPKTKF